MKKFNFENIKIYTEIPTGWRVTENTTTQPNGYKFINNNKSRFSGQRKIGLLKI